MIQIRHFSIIVLVLFNSIFSASVYSQSQKDTTALFVRTSGATNSDIGYSVATDATGNTYVVGQFQGTVLFGQIPLVGSTPTGSLVKYSTNGTVLWAKTIISTNNASILDVKVATDGTVYCIGTFKNNAVFGGGIELTTLSLNTQSFIAQYTSEGVCTQAKKIESNLLLGTVVLNSLAIGSGNSLLITGSFKDSVYFGNNVGIPGVLSNDNAFIARLNFNLVYNWAKRIRSDFSSYGKDIAFDNDGNVVCVGQFTDTADIGSGLLVAQPYSGGDNRSSYIAKFSSDGAGIWIKSFIDSTDEIMTGLAVGNDNTYYTFGTTDGQNVGIAPISITANHSGSEELLVCAISSTGIGLWVKSYGSSNDDKSGKITVVDSSIYIAGRIEGAATFGPNKTLVSAGAGDGLIAKLKTTDGSVVWAKNYGGNGNEFIISIASNPVIGFSACGLSNGTFSIQGKSYTNAGNNDQLFILLGELKNPSIQRPTGTISNIIDTLKWTSALGADSIEIEIRKTDSVNGSVIFSNILKLPDSLLVLPALNYGTTYFFRTQSKLIAGRPSGYSNWIPFSVVSLPQITRIFPQDLATSVSLQTELRWNKPNNLVDSVWIEVKRDSVNGVIWQSFRKISNDTAQVLDLLNPNRNYFWRGKTKASNGDTSSWSTWSSFTTENVLQPAVKSPLNGAVNVPLTAELSWNSPSSYVDTAYIQVRESNANGAIVAQQTYLNKDSIFLCTSIPTKLNSQYVWRLRFGSKLLGAGQWSDWYSFKTELPGGSYNELCAKITGRIIDDGGNPILSGLVTAWRTDTSQGESTVFLFTDSIVNGNYSIDVPTGSYMVFTSGIDYFTKWFPNSNSRANAEVQLLQCSDSIVRNITVTKNPLTNQNLTIRGTIRSKETNLPLVATVQLLPVNNEFQNVGAAITTNSDASGRYELVVPSLQRYLGLAIAPNHSLRVFDTATAYIEGRFIRSGMSDPLNVNFFLDEIPTELQTNGIQGVWTDSLNNPVQGKVIAYRYATLEGDTTVQARFFYSTSTDSTGTFLFKGLEKGKYKIMNAPEDENLVAGFYTFPSPYCIPNWNNSTTIIVDNEIVTLMKNVVTRKKLGDRGAASWTISVVQKTSPLMHSGKKIYEPSSTITEPGVIITLFDKNGGVSDYGFTDVNGNASSASLTAGTFEYEASKVGFLPKKGTIVITTTGIQGGTPVIELEKITEDIISSVSLKEADGVLLYPNPALKQLTIENVPNLAFLESLTIQDIRGIEFKLPFDIFYSEGRIVLSVSSLPVGWYTLFLSTKSTTYSYQFIKQ